MESMTEAVARRAEGMMRRYLRSHNRIGLVDYLVAATAHVRGLQSPFAIASNLNDEA